MPSLYKLAIVGSRSISPSLPEIQAAISLLQARHTKLERCVTIVSGGAKGADTSARLYANSPLHLDPELHDPDVATDPVPHLIEHTPDWEKHGRSAGFKRNFLIAADADAMIAFWNMTSNGTRHSMRLAHKAGIPLLVVSHFGSVS